MSRGINSKKNGGAFVEQSAVSRMVSGTLGYMFVVDHLSNVHSPIMSDFNTSAELGCICKGS